MRIITLNQRQARILRQNLTNNQDGYDYTDLLRIDYLAKRMNTLLGDYAAKIAELAREEKRINRALARASDAEREKLQREMMGLGYDVADLDEAAELVEVTFRVEDGDHKLILDKLEAVGRWAATDELRPVIIGIKEAVKNAAIEAPEDKVGDGEEPIEMRARKR